MRMSIIFLLVLTMYPATTLIGQNVRVTASSPPEALLAALDQGSMLVSQSLVQKYRRILDSIDPKCKETNKQIADFTVTGVRLLKEQKKIRMTNLKFLQAMDESLPEDAESLNLSCAEIAALLVTLIDQP